MLHFTPSHYVPLLMWPHWAFFFCRVCKQRKLWNYSWGYKWFKWRLKKILLTNSSKRISLAPHLSHYYYQYEDHRLIKYKYDNDECTQYVQIEPTENEQFSYRNLPLHLTNGVSYPRCFGLRGIQVLIWSLNNEFDQNEFHKKTS